MTNPTKVAEEIMSPYIAKAIAPHLMEAAKRASDHINLHLAATDWDELKHKYIALRLSDGGSDGVLYDTKRDAVRHQFNEFQCAYIAFRNLPQGSTPREMAIVLQFHRDAYDKGMRLTDPDEVNGGAEPILTSGWTDYYRNQLINGELGRRKLTGPIGFSNRAARRAGR